MMPARDIDEPCTAAAQPGHIPLPCSGPRTSDDILAHLIARRSNTGPRHLTRFGVFRRRHNADCADPCCGIRCAAGRFVPAPLGTILSEWRDATVRLGQIARAILHPAALIVSSWDSGESTDT